MKRLYKILLTMIVGLILMTGLDLKANAATIGPYDFTVHDIRDYNRQKHFDSDGGRYSMIVFGHLTSDQMSKNMIQTMVDLSKFTDTSNLDLYAYDVELKDDLGAHYQDIIAALNAIPGSEVVYVNYQNQETTYRDVWREGYHYFSDHYAAPYLPLVWLIGPDGTILKDTVGTSDLRFWLNVLKECGYIVDEYAGMAPVEMNVQFRQDMARDMLPLVNSFRQESGVWYWNENNSQKILCGSLGNLTYDYELEKVAMQRAAEIALCYGHDRPDKSSCFSAFTELNYTDFGAGSENIAAGYTSAAAAVNAFREENEYFEGQGHRRNMLGDQFAAVGFGCVYYKGYYYWAQEFSGVAKSTTATPADTSTRAVTLRVDPENIMMAVASPLTITVSEGDVYDLNKIAVNLTMYNSFPAKNARPILNKATWMSNDDSIAEVSGSNLIVKKNGETSLRGMLFDRELIVYVTVKEVSRTVGGQITNGVGATVELLQGNEVKYTTSAGISSYAFTGVAAGTYTMRVTRAGYSTAECELVVNSSKTTKNLTLYANPSITHTLSVNSSFSINYYVSKSGIADLGNVKMIIDQDSYTGGSNVVHKTTEVKGVEQYSDGYGYEYKFPYRGITSREVGEQVSAVLVGEKDGVTYKFTPDLYSVSDYCYSRLTKSSNAYLKTLCVDVLNYAAAAQMHFGVKTDQLVNKQLTAAQKAMATPAYSTLSDHTATLQTISSPSATISGKTLVLDNCIELKIYMKMQNTANVKLRLKYKSYDNRQITYDIPASEFTYDGTEYQAKYQGLIAAEFRTPVEIQILRGETPISDKIQYSVETYAYNRLKPGSTSQQSLKDLMAAIMKYSDAAIAYEAHK